LRLEEGNHLRAGQHSMHLPNLDSCPPTLSCSFSLGDSCLPHPESLPHNPSNWDFPSSIHPLALWGHLGSTGNSREWSVLGRGVFWPGQDEVAIASL
jgi:hypothetical protein